MRLFDHGATGTDCSPRCQQVVDYEYTLTRLQPIDVNFESVFPVLQLVGVGTPFVGEFSRFSDRHESDPELQGEGRGKNKAPRFGGDDDIDRFLTIISDQLFNGGLKRLVRGKKRSDVLEQDSRFGEIRYVANVI